MAFAAGLQRLTQIAEREFGQRQLEFEQQVNVKIGNIVEQCMQNFQAACELAANQRRTTCEMNYDICVEELWKKDLYGNEGSAAEAVRTALQSNMATLGFAQASIHLNQYYNELCFAPFDPNMKSYQQKYLLKFSVSWAGVETSDADGPSAPASSGAMLQCPICFETRSGVALYPCGHTVCAACAQTLTNQPCPSCRHPITGSTRGLFIR